MSNFMHYLDYTGSIEFSEEDEVFHGKVIGIRDMITFEGDSVKTLTADFHSAVDEYLEFCKESGKEPEKPFKGSFNVRIEPKLHREAVLAASVRGLSLNAFVEDAIRNNVIMESAAKYTADKKISLKELRKKTEGLSLNMSEEVRKTRDKE